MSSGNEHVIVWDRTPAQVTDATNRSGLVSPFEGGTVFYPADEFSTPPGTIAAELSNTLDTQTMWAGTFDDDIVSLMLYRHGEPRGEITIPDPADYYELDPQEIELLAELGEQAGVPNQENSTPQQFLTAAGITPDPATSELLTELDDNNFALDNQRILYQALHLPDFPIGWGHGAPPHPPQHSQAPPPHPTNP